jgi:hypothetical protein
LFVWLPLGSRCDRLRTRREHPKQQDQITDQTKGKHEAMSRLRIALLSLVAVFAVNMLAAEVASAEGPYWYVGGTKLVQGSKGIKLQSKGPLVLKSEVPGTTTKVEISCGRSTADGTIDGQGATRQGQGKGIVTYEQCKVTLNPSGACGVEQPIKTNQLKSHLVREVFQGGEQNGELFEPSTSQQTTGFVKIHLINCGILGGVYEVKGSVVADIVPSEVESQEGTLHFPEPRITEVKHEGQIVEPKLLLGTKEATFTGQYGTRLQSGENFGVKTS